MKKKDLIDVVIDNYPNSGCNEIERAWNYSDVYDMMTEYGEQLTTDLKNKIEALEIELENIKITNTID